MKYVLILLFCFASFVSYSQCGMTLPDTAFNNSVTLITYNSARVNSNVENGDVSGSMVILKYVRVGQTDTVTSTTAWPISIRNLTGLVASTQYVYYYTLFCGAGGVAQLGRYYFTTLANTISYYPNFQPTKFPYIKADTGFKAPSQDTSIFRAPNTGGDIVFKPSDGKFYGYNGTYWTLLAVDSAGIIPALNLKVDSVVVSGDSLFWYCCGGVGHGYVLPTNLAWSPLGNSGTVAGTNFLGTTDAVDLVFKTGGDIIGRLSGDDLYRVCFGDETNSATGPFSTVSGGAINVASGDYSTIGGGDFQIASAEFTTISGGDANTASAPNATIAGGTGNIASGNTSSILGGGGNKATGELSSVLGGANNKSKSYGGVVGGLFNDSTNATSSTSYNVLNRVFQIGIGTADNARSNAMTVLFNGNVGIGKLVPAYKLDVNGSGTVFVQNVLNTSNGYALVAAGTSTSSTEQIFQTLGGAGAVTERFAVYGNGKITAPSLAAGVGTKAVRWDATLGLLLADTTAAGASALTVGTTTITGGTNTRILYNNLGILAEYTLTGTGTTVMMAASPTTTGTLTGANGRFTGDIEVGTTTSGSQFSVIGAGGGLTIESATGNGFAINRDAAVGTIFNAGLNAYQFNNAAGGLEMQVYSGAGSFIGYGWTIDGSGNMGVKNNAPTAALDVTGTMTTSGVNTLSNLAGSGNRAVVASATGVLSATQPAFTTKFGNFSGVGTATTVFTVTFGGTLPNATYSVNVTPTAALSAALFYVTNKTTTTFDVTYLAGLTGTVTFDYTLTQ